MDDQAVQPFDGRRDGGPLACNRLTVRLANVLSNAGLTCKDETGEEFVNRVRLEAMSELDLVHNLGRNGREELRAHGLIAPAKPARWEHGGELARLSVRVASALVNGGLTRNAARMAAIGRAVVHHLVGNNHRDVRDATPERVVERLERRKAEAHAVETSQALRVGRLVMALVDELTTRKAR